MHSSKRLKISDEFNRYVNRPPLYTDYNTFIQNASINRLTTESTQYRNQFLNRNDTTLSQKNTRIFFNDSRMYLPMVFSFIPHEALFPLRGITRMARSIYIDYTKQAILGDLSSSERRNDLSLLLVGDALNNDFSEMFCGVKYDLQFVNQMFGLDKNSNAVFNMQKNSYNTIKSWTDISSVYKTKAHDFKKLEGFELLQLQYESQKNLNCLFWYIRLRNIKQNLLHLKRIIDNGLHELDDANICLYKIVTKKVNNDFYNTMDDFNEQNIKKITQIKTENIIDDYIYGTLHLSKEDSFKPFTDDSEERFYFDFDAITMMIRECNKLKMTKKGVEKIFFRITNHNETILKIMKSFEMVGKYIEILEPRVKSFVDFMNICENDIFKDQFFDYHHHLPLVMNIDYKKDKMFAYNREYIEESKMKHIDEMFSMGDPETMYHMFKQCTSPLIRWSQLSSIGSFDRIIDFASKIEKRDALSKVEWLKRQIQKYIYDSIFEREITKMHLNIKYKISTQTIKDILFMLTPKNANTWTRSYRSLFKENVRNKIEKYVINPKWFAKRHVELQLQPVDENFLEEDVYDLDFQMIDNIFGNAAYDYFYYLICLEDDEYFTKIYKFYLSDSSKYQLLCRILGNFDKFDFIDMQSLKLKSVIKNLIHEQFDKNNMNLNVVLEHLSIYLTYGIMDINVSKNANVTPETVNQCLQQSQLILYTCRCIDDFIYEMYPYRNYYDDHMAEKMDRQRVSTSKQVSHSYRSCFNRLQRHGYFLSYDESQSIELLF